jgi:hypothetical protein
MSMPFQLTDVIVKPAASALLFLALDRALYDQNSGRSIKSSFINAAAISGGTVVGMLLAQFAPVSTSNYPIFGNLKGVESRILEVGGGIGASYVLNTLVLQNTYSNTLSMKAIGIVVLCDLGAELISDVVAGRSLNLWDASN